MASSTWRLAGRTIWRSRGRSVLMGLGLVVGVVSISLTVATGEGARQAVEKSFKAMIGDLDVLLISPGGAAQRGMANLETSITTLSADDADAIRGSVSNVRAVGMQQSDLAADIEVNGKPGTTALFGSTANWAQIRGDSVMEGAFFTDDDGHAMARVAVLGSDVARDYFGTESPLGKHIRLKGIDFDVVGVLAPNGAGPGGVSMDNLVHIPFETGRRRVFNKEQLSLVSVKLIDPSRSVQTQAAVRALLRRRHGKVNDDLDDFRVSSPQAMIARVANVDTTLRKALFLVGALALVIGGVVVANLMFAATVARRQEIATRRAVGATSSDILRQFWAEAVLIAIAAAATGSVVAIGATKVGASAMRMPLAISWPTTIGTTLVAVAIGALAGYLPARRAARMSPVEGLRDAT